MTSSTHFRLKKMALGNILAWCLAAASLMLSVGAAPAGGVPVAYLDKREEAKPVLPTYSTHDEAWKALDAAFENKQPLAAAIFVKESNTLISNIKYDVGDEKNDNEKRSLGKLIKHFFHNAGKVLPGISFDEHQVNSQGTYFAGWAPVSCPYYNEFSTGDVRHDFQTIITHTRTYSAGFDIKFGALAALNIGATITDSEQYIRWDSYTVPAGSICQLWVQPLRLWQNQQIRSCHRASLTDGTKICGGWGAVIHGDFLVENKTVPNMQCGAHVDKTHCGT